MTPQSVYDYKPYYDTAAQRIQKSEILTNKEKELIKDFDSHLAKKRTSIARRLGVLSRLLLIREKYLTTPYYESTNRNAIEEFVDNVNKDTIQERTKSDYKDVLKQLYRWMNKDIVPEYIAWIRGKQLKDIRQIREKTSQDILTAEEQKALLNATTNKRDYAIVKLLIEAGLRPNELLRLQVKHFDPSPEKFCWLTIPSDTKTGSRTIPLVASVKAIKDYLVEHPYKEDAEALLWQGYKQGEGGRGFNYQGFRLLCRRLRIRAKLKKRFHPYLFRYTSYTNKANAGWSELKIKTYHGLAKDSRMLSVYVKTDPKMLVDDVLALAGKKVIKKSEQLKEFVICPRCGEENEADKKQCAKCLMILDLEEAQKLTEKVVEEQKHKDKEMTELKENMALILKRLAAFDKGMKLENLKKL